MNLDEIKKLVADLGYSEEIKKSLQDILDRGIQRGELKPDEASQMLGIVEKENERLDNEIDVLSNASSNLSQIISSVKQYKTLEEEDLKFFRELSKIDEVNNDQKADDKKPN